MRKHLPDWKHFLDKTLPTFPNHKIVERIGSGCNGHVYRAHAEEIEGDLAFKFVPTENLPADPEQCGVYLVEAKKANSLEDSCVVRYVDVLPWEDDALGRTFVVFVCQYISGSSLEQFIKTNRHNIHVAFVENFLSTMFSLLFELDLSGREDDRTVEERFESERSRLLPLPGRPYENYKPLRVKVGRYQTVRVDRNRYSVPTAYAGRWVWAHVSQQKMGANGSA